MEDIDPLGLADILKPPQAHVDSDDEIPSVLLKSALANSKIVQKDREIERQFELQRQTEEKNKRELELATSKILQELNDNGSGFQYTHKHHDGIIRDYVSLTQAADILIHTRRHFFYFKEVEKVKLQHKKLPTLQEVVKWPSNFGTSTLDRVMKKHNINLVDLVEYTLCHVDDISILDSAVEYVNSSALARSSSAELFQSLMIAIGADPKFFSTSTATPSTEMELKYSHFNPFSALTVRRVALVLAVCADADPLLILRHLFLTLSDFLLQKEHHGMLVQIAYLILHRLDSRGSDLDESLAHSLELILTLLYGNDEPNDAKTYEAQFNILSVMWECRAIPEHILRCIKRFTVAESSNQSESNDQTTILLLVRIVLDISDTPILQKSRVTKNAFRALLVRILTMDILYGETDYDTQEVLRLYQTLTKCKDRLQSDLGLVSFDSQRDDKEKAQLTGALAEAYHTFADLGMVLGKHVPFLQDDIFYELDSENLIVA